MYLKTQKQGSTFAAVLLAIMIFARCKPFYLWAVEDIQRIIFSIMIPIVCFFYLKLNKRSILYFALFLTSFIILGFHRIGVMRFFNAALLCLIPIIQPAFAKHTYSIFLKIFCVILLLSLFNYLIALLGVKPVGFIEPLNNLKDFKYPAYPFLVIADTSSAIFRFCGVFDEPGAVGTICGLMLYINGIKLNRWENICLLLGGLFSFSLFFYVIIFLAPFAHASIKTKILTLASIVLILILINQVSFLYDLIGHRLQWDSDTLKLTGDSRINLELADALKEERFSRAYWWGHPTGGKDFEGLMSFNLTGYTQGFLFIYVNIVAYLSMAYQHIYKINKTYFLIFCLIFAAVIYQRPELFSANYIFLFTVLIYELKEQAIALNNENNYDDQTTAN